MKLTLVKVGRFDKDQEGQLLTTKDGRAYTRIKIKTIEHKADILSGFASWWNKDWEVGMTVEAEVEQNGMYLNLKAPKKVDPDLEYLKEQVDILLEWKKKTENRLNTDQNTDKTPTPQKVASGKFSPPKKVEEDVEFGTGFPPNTEPDVDEVF